MNNLWNCTREVSRIENWWNLWQVYLGCSDCPSREVVVRILSIHQDAPSNLPNLRFSELTSPANWRELQNCVKHRTFVTQKLMPYDPFYSLKYIWIWLSLSCVPCFPGYTWRFIYIKGYTVVGNQGTHDKLNQIYILS